MLFLNMILYFISSISWQLVAVAVIIILYKKIGFIKSLFVKHNGTEFGISMIDSGEKNYQLIINNQLGTNQVNASKKPGLHVQAQNAINSMYKWRKYSNGFLVLQFQIKLSQYINTKSQTITYPLSMSNEVISTQLISALNLKIVRLEKSFCEIKSLSYIKDEELEQVVEVIICGF